MGGGFHKKEAGKIKSFDWGKLLVDQGRAAAASRTTGVRDDGSRKPANLGKWTLRPSFQGAGEAGEGGGKKKKSARPDWHEGKTKTVNRITLVAGESERFDIKG